MGFGLSQGRCGMTFGSLAQVRIALACAQLEVKQSLTNLFPHRCNRLPMGCKLLSHGICWLKTHYQKYCRSSLHLDMLAMIQALICGKVKSARVLWGICICFWAGKALWNNKSELFRCCLCLLMHCMVTSLPPMRAMSLAEHASACIFRTCMACATVADQPLAENACKRWQPHYAFIGSMGFKEALEESSAEVATALCRSLFWLLGWHAELGMTAGDQLLQLLQSQCKFALK